MVPVGTGSVHDLPLGCEDSEASIQMQINGQSKPVLSAGLKEDSNWSEDEIPGSSVGHSHICFLLWTPGQCGPGSIQMLHLPGRVPAGDTERALTSAKTPFPVQPFRHFKCILFLWSKELSKNW